MNNIMQKQILALVFVAVAALSVAAFLPKTVDAEDFGTMDFDCCGGYIDSSYSTGGLVDSWSGMGGYIDSSYPSGGGYVDSWYGSTGGGYIDSSYDSLGGYIDSSYGSTGGYIDSSYNSFGGYIDSSYDSLGGYIDSSYGSTGGYVDSWYGSYDSTGGYVDSYYGAVGNCCTSTGISNYDYTSTVYSADCGCYTASPSYSTSYAQAFAQSYIPSYAQSFVQNPILSTPSYSYPSYSYPSYPTYQQPQQPRPTTPSYTTNTSNYCTNGSCNTSIVDNSINGSFNDYSINGSFNTTAPIYTATAQPIVSYQIPTYTYPSYTQGAYCTIVASPTSIANGQAATLSWSSNGTSAWLSDGIGSVAANGSLAVRPNTTRTYVLTVNGYNGSNTCSVTITVAGTAPYVSLSQIPYTGFDFGVVGNTIYWMGLAGLALALTYLVLYFKGGAVAFAGSMFSRPAAVAHTAPAHDEDHADTHSATPTHMERTLKDTMSITRAADGTPRIVINRA